MRTPAAAAVLVAAAVVRDDSGAILLTRRPPGRHMAGLWEFPGGKVDPGEHPEHALARELEEELAVRIEVTAPLTFAVHEEPGRQVILLFYTARLRAGTPRAMEGQEIAWVPPEHLRDLPTPPADAALVRLLAPPD